MRKGKICLRPYGPRPVAANTAAAVNGSAAAAEAAAAAAGWPCAAAAEDPVGLCVPGHPEAAAKAVAAVVRPECCDVTAVAAAACDEGVTALANAAAAAGLRCEAAAAAAAGRPPAAAAM